MKFLFLVILYTQVFSGTHNMPVVQRVVSSPKEAAVLLWKENELLRPPEPGYNEAHLYEIDLVSGTAKEVEIPEIKFQSPENKLNEHHNAGKQ